METTLSRTGLRSHASAALLMLLLAIVLTIVAIQARSVLSSATTATVRPAVVGVERHAPSKDEFLRSHRETSSGTAARRQIIARKG